MEGQVRKWAAGLRGAEVGAGRRLAVIWGSRQQRPLYRDDLVNSQTGRRPLERRPLPCGSDSGTVWSVVDAARRVPPLLPRGRLCLGLLLWDSAGLLGGRPGWRGLVFVHSPEKKALWTQ